METGEWLLRPDTVEKLRFWRNWRNFCSYGATSFFRRGVRPNWFSVAHVPAHCASWPISSDFSVLRVFSEKLRHLKFGVFQQNPRTAAVRRLKMLYAALVAASVGRIAAFHKRAERQVWAVSDIRHKGRRAGVRCKCELKFELQREPTFNLSQIYGSCCDAEGSCEPIATDAAIYTNLTGARKSNIGREGFLSRQSVSTD